MKLSNRLLSSILPITSISLLILGAVAFWQLNHVQKQKMISEMDNAIHRLNETLDHRISNTRSDSELIANSPAIVNFMLEQDSDQRYLLWHSPLLRELSSIQQALPEYFELRLLDTAGNEIARRVNRDIDNHDLNESRTSWFAQIQNRQGISSFIAINPDTDEPVIYTVNPIIKRDPRVEGINVEPSLRGYLVITSALSHIRQMINTQRPGEEGFMLALSRHGRLLFKPDGLKPVPAVPVKPLFQTSSRHRTIESGNYLYMADNINGYIHFVSVVPKRVFTAATSQLALSVLLIIIATIISLTLVLYTLMRKQVIRPIDYLISLAHKIGLGELEIQNTYRQQDEFGELAEAFEQMALGLKKSAEKIQFMAYHDTLTGLPNRAHFHQDMDQSMARAKRTGDKFALLFVDIDDFKQVNDSRGHVVGDQLLKAITDRVNQQLRENDMILNQSNRDSQDPSDDPLFSRIGGDEFAILLSGIDDPIYAGSISQRLIEIISQPFTIDQCEIHVGASIGVAIFPEDSQDPDELIKYADIAMYHAKASGKNNYQFYQTSMNRKIHEKLHMEARLRLALEENRLQLVFQPQVATATRILTGLEALIRWNDPELGPVSPDIFIPIAEETGMIHEIGEWVIQEACRQQAEWIQKGLEPVTVSVNVSGKQFDRHDVTEMLELALTQHRLEPGHLGIEITESTAMTEPLKTASKLQQISERGIKISLDDFGTGYSSLSHLQTFSVDVLKIDRSFVSTLSSGQQYRDLTNAIVVIAHLMNMSVIAEGVETEEQLSILHGFKCDNIQGSMFSSPLHVNDIPALLNKRTFH